MSTLPLRGDARDVLRLAWPATLSFLLNNAFRINDQYWVEGLGPEAQAAVGTTTFVLIMNFSVLFLAGGGALTHIARAVGAGDVARRDSLIRCAVGFALCLAAALSVLGSSASGGIIQVLGLEGGTGEHAQAYLHTLYLGLGAMVLVPVLDSVFAALGNTRMTLCMQLISVSVNFALNPVLIYGHGVSSFEGFGIAGAALATICSRLAAGSLGLFILVRVYRVQIVTVPRPDWEKLRTIFLTGLPTSLSIATYAGVYWLVVATVLSKLGRDVMAGGLGIGFTVFEGLSFPCFLGIGVAVASLVGRSLGSGDVACLARSLRTARRAALGLGVFWAGAFQFGAPLLAPAFTSDEGVLAEALLYTGILAWSQLFVAIEAVEERVLLGAGRTRLIFAVSVPGNLLRVPLAWLLAIEFELGAAGVWWAINATTAAKAVALHLCVRSVGPSLVPLASARASA